LITHRFPLRDIQKAFNTVCESNKSLKVIIDFGIE